MMAVLTSTCLAACGSAGSGDLEATDAWVRFSGTNGAAYVTLSNTTDEADALTGASVPQEVARSVEIHQTTTSEGDMLGMQMKPVVDLPADFELQMKPGSYHLMLMDISDNPPAAGENISLTLQFDRHEPITVDAEVRR
jgi:copper(I)-binding protein